MLAQQHVNNGHLATAEPGHFVNEWAANLRMKPSPIAKIRTMTDWQAKASVLTSACFECHKEKCITVNILHHLSHQRVCCHVCSCMFTSSLSTGSSSVYVF